MELKKGFIAMESLLSVEELGLFLQSTMVGFLGPTGSLEPSVTIPEDIPSSSGLHWHYAHK